MYSRIWVSCLIYTAFMYTNGEPACVFSQGDNTFNLTSLQKIYETTDLWKWKYSFKLCVSFKLGTAGDCKSDVAICRWGPNDHEKVGTQSSMEFGFDKQTTLPKLQYCGEGQGMVWKCTVLLKCDSNEEEGSFDIWTYDNSSEIVFILRHKCACANGCLIRPSLPTPTEPTTPGGQTTDKIMIEIVSGASGGVFLIAVLIFMGWRIRRWRRNNQYNNIDHINPEDDVHNNLFPAASDHEASELTSGRGSSFRPSLTASSCSGITVPKKDDNLKSKMKKYEEELC